MERSALSVSVWQVAISQYHSMAPLTLGDRGLVQTEPPSFKYQASLRIIIQDRRAKPLSRLPVPAAGETSALLASGFDCLPGRTAHSDRWQQTV